MKIDDREVNVFNPYQKKMCKVCQFAGEGKECRIYGEIPKRYLDGEASCKHYELHKEKYND